MIGVDEPVNSRVPGNARIPGRLSTTERDSKPLTEQVSQDLSAASTSLGVESSRVSSPDGLSPGLERRSPDAVPVPAIPAIVHSMSIDRMNLHLISDATGETINAIARATTVQFDHVDILYHRWSLIRSRLQLHRVIGGIEAEPGPVLSTLVDRALNVELEAACQRLAVPVINVLAPVMTLLQDFIGTRGAARPGKQYVLNADYFRRIDAMHYVLAHDDGQAQPGLAEADVVLVGVSRSSKTPTCFYLANRGIKAANVPLVPNTPLPPELEVPHYPVIGLTLDARVLIDIRRHRLKLIGTSANIGMVRQNGAGYVDEEAVKAELLWARRLCLGRGWPVIDVTRRSIEETAATILQLMDAWHEGQTKASPPAPSV